jgi:LemA protein
MRGMRLVVPLLLLSLTGCGYNRIQTLDEQVNGFEGQIKVQLQRRADLVPNLVNTVKGYAAQEEKVLREVTEARASVGRIQITPELASDPAKLQEFQKAQGELSGALSRLLVVSENYPDLKSNQNFLALQSQLEGTENRITVARNKFINAVQQYNTKVRSVPSNFTAMIFGYKTKPSFTVANEAQISVPPPVSFEKPASR